MKENDGSHIGTVWQYKLPSPPSRNKDQRSGTTFVKFWEKKTIRRNVPQK